MAQPSTTSNLLDLKTQFQTLTNQASQQQTQFNLNKQFTNTLQSNLSNNSPSKPLRPIPQTNQNNDEESKTTKTAPIVTTNTASIEATLATINTASLEAATQQLTTMKISKTGIDAATQGKLTIHHKNQELASNHYQSAKYVDFASMSSLLRAELLDGCDKMNFTHPSKIQAEAIPICLNSHSKSPQSTASYPNLIGQAHHGSGKTATFALIMLQRVLETHHKLQGLVVVHSRELAIQTHRVVQSLGQFISGLKICLALRGELMPSPWDCQICIGTPGTMIDKILNASKRSKEGLKGFLSEFKIFIVDEADEFLKAQGTYRRSNRGKGRGRGARGDFGSLFDQLKMIFVDLTQNRTKRFQTMLFSATFPSTVKKLALEIASDPFIIKVAQKSVQLDNIKIFKVPCANEVDKFNTLLRVISLANIGQMIIFVNTVKKAKQLIDGLEGKDLGIACSALYGRGMDIALRDKTMEQFRRNQTHCLVASNVIARGIDVPSVGLVVNFEIPITRGHSTETGMTGFTFDSETFMHRVGRTGRFGAKGVCINLIGTNDSIKLDAIKKEYELDIKELDKSPQAIKESITMWLHDQ
eukprot:12597_1